MSPNATIIELLQRVEGAGGVSNLFAALGYRQLHHELSHKLSVVASWRGFKVLCMEADTSVEAARQIARKSQSLGERALAVGLSSQTIALTAPRIGVPGITRTLSLSLEAPTTYALNQLQLLRPAGNTTALAHSLRVAEVLDSEPAGDRFFHAFRRIFERMVAECDSTMPEDDRRILALLALTRLLFLYFVQAKGWLNEQQDYLRTLFDKTLIQRKSFHRHALRPLFFGTLNKPLEERAHIPNLGTIPYLNGGLFEPHALERRWARVTFTNELWRDAFDELFERFRFCVREASEVDAIAPDMLGRIFERLGQKERLSTGTFYTPEIIVKRLVDATIEAFLIGKNGLSSCAAQQVVAGESLDLPSARAAQKAISELRLLDPAVGSGAFLLGALKSLTQINLSLSLSKRPDSLSQIRRRVLRENLLGVDIDPIAVRLAELRLWLAIVADDPQIDIKRVEPLPNLNGILRQGDTLMDPLGSASAHGYWRNSNTTRSFAEIQRCRVLLFDARGNDRKAALTQLRRTECSLARELLNGAAGRIEHALTELENVSTGKNLFGRRSGLTSAQRETYRWLLEKRRELAESLGSVERGQLPFFSFEVHSPETMSNGGFDVVVGNPPWVRAERLSPTQRSLLQQRFSWWRTHGTSGYAHQPDLSVAFLQRAFELAAPGGAIGMLIPSKVTTANYARVARSHIGRETEIQYLHRVPGTEASSFGATTYPLALVAKKTRPTKSSIVYCGFNRKKSIRQSRLSSEAPLCEFTKPSIGIKTGADRILVGTVELRSADTSVVRFGDDRLTVENSVLRSALRGRDISAFQHTSRRVIMWGYDETGQLLGRLPPLASRHIESHYSELCQRVDYTGGPAWILFRTRIALEPALAVWSDISRVPRAVVLENSHATPIPLNTCYAAGHRDATVVHAIACVINTTWTSALVRVTADEARGGYRRLNARVAQQIPLPTTRSSLELLASISKQAHQGNADRDKVDETVAKVLDLPRSTQDTLRQIANDRS